MDVVFCLCRDIEVCIINIVYWIKEGLCVYIECININGNICMFDKVVCREFWFVEGDVYNKVLINWLRFCICGFGFFSEVEIEEEFGMFVDKIVLNVNVEE